MQAAVEAEATTSAPHEGEPQRPPRRLLLYFRGSSFGTARHTLLSALLRHLRPPRNLTRGSRDASRRPASASLLSPRASLPPSVRNLTDSVFLDRAGIRRATGTLLEIELAHLHP